MYSRDLERLVRSFVAQKLEREYIIHYLVETYQLDIKGATEVLDKVAPPIAGRRGAAGKPAENGTNPPPIKRQRFY